MEGVPEVARFNAGQKFVFWSMALLVPVLFVTGIMIRQQRVAVLIHGIAAETAIIVWIIHVYAAVRAMTQGYVKWLRRLVAAGSSGPTT